MFADAPLEFRDREIQFPDADVLVSVGPDTQGRDARLHPGAASAWLAMKAAASADGIELLLVSAFRSFADQVRIVERKRARGLSWPEILLYSAYPGFSEHHTGRAIDIASADCLDLTERFEGTPQFRWLVENAGRFGFTMSYPRGNTTGIAYEPWHWLWTGK
jgi:zinc D-Ala-D-Ala carboxypeptidase